MGYRNDRWAPDPTLLTGSTTLRPGLVFKYDTTLGAISQPLPQASGIAPSQSLFLLREIGDLDLTVTPFAGDTINGSSAPVILGAVGGSCLFVRDSVSTNWLCLGVGLGSVFALHTISGTIGAYELASLWNGTDLTATLPIAPPNGTEITVRNLNITPLSMAAGAGDTLNDTDPVVGSQTYRYLASTNVWYTFVTIGAQEFFGDGSAGDVTLPLGNTTLPGTVMYNNLTIPVGATLLPDGGGIFVKGRLLNQGTISVAGNAAAGQTAGIAYGGNRYLYATGGLAGGLGGAIGGAGAPGTGQTTSGIGGSGGAGGAAVGAAGIGGANTVSPAGTNQTRHAVQINMHRVLNGVAAGQVPGAGGGGGGGGGSGVGGGGGGGASLLQIYAHYIDNRSGAITANGGAGGNGAGGGAGGGGGGGGYGLIVADIYQGNAATAAGGTPGTGNGAGGNGVSGSAGTIVLLRTR